MISAARSSLPTLALVGAVSEAIQHWLLDDYRDDVETLVAATRIVFSGVSQVIAQQHQAPAAC